MLTKEQIENKGFKYSHSFDRQTIESEFTVDVYYGIGTNNLDQERALQLEYNGEGYLTIKDYFNKGLQLRELYYAEDTVTGEELDKLIEDFKFTITEIDLTTLTSKWI